jgi:PAS domain-containing protein
VIYRDITDRKRLENDLRRSQAYLAAGQHLSHTGSWARNVATGEIYWSEEVFRIFGLDPATTMRGELLASCGTRMTAIPPRTRLRRRFARSGPSR